MESLGFLVGVILPPITLVVLVGGLLYRVRYWWKLPTPKLTLFPAPEPGPDHLVGVLKATFFFPGLFKSDRTLWLFAWGFHAMLALILLGHLRVVTDFPRLWAALGINADTMSAGIGGTAGILILLTAALLLFRRFRIPRVREITQAGDYIALFLLLAIILSGNAMRFLGHFELAQTREYFANLMLLKAPLPPQKPWFLLHFLLGQTLFLYLPFSKILHFGGIFFTQAALQRR